MSTVDVCEADFFSPDPEKAGNFDNDFTTEKSRRIAGWMRVSIVTTISGISMLLNQILSSGKY